MITIDSIQITDWENVELVCNTSSSNQSGKSWWFVVVCDLLLTVTFFKSRKLNGTAAEAVAPVVAGNWTSFIGRYCCVAGEQNKEDTYSDIIPCTWCIMHLFYYVLHTFSVLDYDITTTTLDCNLSYRIDIVLLLSYC